MDMRVFKQTRDANVNGVVLSMSPTAVDCLSLTASTAAAYTIPSNVDSVLVYSLKDVYVSVNATVTLGTTLGGTAPMPNPGVLVLDPTDTKLTILSETDCKVFVYRWSKG